VRTHLKGYVVNVTDDHFPEYLHRMRHGAIRRLMVHYTWPVDVFVDLMIWQSDFGERYVEIWNPRANPQPKEPLRFKLPKRARSATRKLAQIEKLIRAILDQE
jgi:hypothetical protein